MAGRLHKSIINAEVNLLFYFLSLILAFFSRRIFLNNLGAEFIGLTGTLGNILGYLNLAELGIGSCISVFLYKPLQSGNRGEICEILSVLGYMYRWIGRVILLAGVLISLSFPFIFRSADLSLGIIYFTFFSFLGSSLIGYFINYRQILLGADQKKYVVAIYFQSAGLVKTVAQILLAFYYKNLYVWVAVEFIFGILGCIVLNWKIDKEYPWLKTDKASGKALLKKYPGILTNTKQIFIHRIKDFLLGRSDELFVFIFVSLKMVAYYGNYTMIVSKISLLFHSVFDSINAGVGNLVAEGNKQNTLKVFWELVTLKHFVAGFICFTIYNFIDPFIVIWLGEEYILDHNILVLLTIYIYINNSRGGVDTFNHAHGLYADVWAAWAELVINVSVTLVCGYFYGIAGILMGKIVSTIFIVVLWKPYYLFKSGLKLPYSEYWEGAIRNYLISAVSFFAATIILSHISFSSGSNIFNWVLNSSLGTLAYLAINILLLTLFARGMKDFLRRVKILK